MSPEPGTIVVVEDDPNIADLIDMYLRRDGHRVISVERGEAGLEAVERERPRLVILDVGLPGGMDGFEVCRRIRATSAVPVLMLTARGDEIDRVLGFELGADDYVTKPFSPRELASRVKAIIRRSDGSAGGPGSAGAAGAAGRAGAGAGAGAAAAAAAVIDLGGLEVDLGRREARAAGSVVALATREFDLLAFLARNRGLALSRRQLLDGVWGPGWYGDERTVDVHVGQLRKKFGAALALKTIWGVGYRLD
ncbi:MAG TPA: response regulator transcription factor [Acidimicrobiales bacterium]|nr:response regulator transcription factor [Acidimicrobiales bacterium]